MNDIRELAFDTRNAQQVLNNVDSMLSKLFSSFFEMSRCCQGIDHSSLFLRLFGRRLEDAQLKKSREVNRLIYGKSHYCVLCDEDGRMQVDPFVNGPDSSATASTADVVAAAPSSKASEPCGSDEVPPTMLQRSAAAEVN